MPIEGMGPCPVPTEYGGVCGRSIKDGDPVGVFVQNPVVGGQVGHRECVTSYLERKEMVKRVSQQGAGGAVDFSQATDMVQNATPIPEYKSGKVDLTPADLQGVVVGRANPDTAARKGYVDGQFPHAYVPAESRPVATDTVGYEPAECGTPAHLRPAIQKYRAREAHFEDDLEHLLNYHGEDARAETPDYILAEYLVGCLESYRRASRRTNQWSA